MITFDDMLERVGSFRDPHARKALAIGLALRYIEKRWGARRAALHLLRSLPAIDADQFEFCFDAHARAIGFVTWATVDAPDMDRMIESGPAALNGANWAGGDNLWIVDFYVHPGMLAHLLVHLRDHVLDRYASVAYFRYRNRMRIAKQLSRTDLAGFRGERRALETSVPASHSMNADLLYGRMGTFMQYHQVGQLVHACILAERTTGLLARSLRVINGMATMRQFRVYAQPGGRPSGVLTWAWLSDHTIARIGHIPLHEVHASEWNEGDNLCVFDIAVSSSCLGDMEADIARELFAERRHVLLYVAEDDNGPARFMRFDRHAFRNEIAEWLAACLKPTVRRERSHAPQAAMPLNTMTTRVPHA